MADWRPALMPALFYRDPRAALKWLAEAFDFELFMLIEDNDGHLVHSEMRFGEAAVSIGTEWSEDHLSPASLGGRNTQTLSIHIETDIGAHCERARRAGAEIIAEPEDQFYGDRSYRCRDPEGHIWSIGQTVRPTTREEAEAASGLKIEGWI